MALVLKVVVMFPGRWMLSNSSFLEWGKSRLETKEAFLKEAKLNDRQKV